MKALWVACVIPIIAPPNYPQMLSLPSPATQSFPGPVGSYSAAERRAENYRALYEYCGPHHDCINRTASGRKEGLKVKWNVIKGGIYDNPREVNSIFEKASRVL